MKELEFKTSKGEFILIDEDDEGKVKLPIDLEYLELGRVKTMTEEQFADVVGSDDDYGVTMYQNYATTSMAYFDEQITAKESFESLVKSLGYYLFENPYQYDWDELCRYGHGDFSKNGKSSYDLYMEADSKTFKNPILLKKL